MYSAKCKINQNLILISPTVLPTDVNVDGVAVGVFLVLVVRLVFGVDLAWWMVMFLMEMWLVS